MKRASDQNERRDVASSEPTRTPVSDPTADPTAPAADPGGYLGSRPERQAHTIPGGVRPDDVRIAALSSTRGPVRNETDTPDPREAGQDR